MRYLLGLILLIVCSTSFGAGVDEHELFSASEAGLIDVRFIPQNYKTGNIILTNNTDKPLTIKLPSTFGAVPVLAQIANFGQFPQQVAQNPNNAGFGSGGIGASPQRLGGSVPNQNQNPFAQIGPRGKRVIRVATVCLDYGARTPTALMPYKISPLAEVTNDNTISSALVAMSTGDLNQDTAQAVAWHKSSDMDWINLSRTGLFNRQDLVLAQNFCATADRKENTTYSL